MAVVTEDITRSSVLTNSVVTPANGFGYFSVYNASFVAYRGPDEPKRLGVRLNLDGLFARGEGSKASYTFRLDTDGDPATGQEVGGMPGVDRILQIDVTGVYPFKEGLKATLINTADESSSPIEDIHVESYDREFGGKSHPAG